MIRVIKNKENGNISWMREDGSSVPYWFRRWFELLEKDKKTIRPVLDLLEPDLQHGVLYEVYNMTEEEFDALRGTS